MLPAIALIGIVLLAGCTQRYTAFQAPALDFSDRNPLYLRVDDVVVESAHEPAGQPPVVEHTLPVTPAAAARELLQYRLRAAGGAGTVRAVIQEAEVKEQPLPTTQGLAGYLTSEPSAQLAAHLKVRVERLDELGNVVSSVSTAVRRTRAIPENAAFVTRQELGYELVRDLVNDLDAGLVTNLRDSFATLITAAPDAAVPTAPAPVRVAPLPTSP